DDEDEAGQNDESDDEDEAALVIAILANMITELLKLTPRMLSPNRRAPIEIKDTPLLKVEDSIESQKQESGKQITK
ncbi:hypothetical protein, partial [Methanocrinis sp.]|uniref:hypothetical protein n=1 Tax=Methanocrinis sp. TaxID=3101522 RepID=UPI003D1339F5